MVSLTPLGRIGGRRPRPHPCPRTRYTRSALPRCPQHMARHRCSYRLGLVVSSIFVGGCHDRRPDPQHRRIRRRPGVRAHPAGGGGDRRDRLHRLRRLRPRRRRGAGGADRARRAADAGTHRRGDAHRRRGSRLCARRRAGEWRGLPRARLRRLRPLRPPEHGAGAGNPRRGGGARRHGERCALRLRRRLRDLEPTSSAATAIPITTRAGTRPGSSAPSPRPRRPPSCGGWTPSGQAMPSGWRRRWPQVWRRTSGR